MWGVDNSRYNEYYSGMSGRLKHEIKQTKPFESLEAEAFLNLLRTTDMLSRGEAELLKTVDLSHTQFNILRILRGAAPEALTCKEIGERLISRDPDITRLLDRMEERGWVKRVRGEKDRRVVLTRITEKGLQLAEMMSEPLRALHTKQLKHLGMQKLQQLINLLEEAREKV
jgi:DNA-binding MarR family transcriptional regulator